MYCTYVSIYGFYVYVYICIVHVSIYVFYVYVYININNCLIHLLLLLLIHCHLSFFFLTVICSTFKLRTHCVASIGSSITFDNKNKVAKQQTPWQNLDAPHYKSKGSIRCHLYLSFDSKVASVINRGHNGDVNRVLDFSPER